MLHIYWTAREQLINDLLILFMVDSQQKASHCTFILSLGGRVLISDFCFVFIFIFCPWAKAIIIRYPSNPAERQLTKKK